MQPGWVSILLFFVAVPAHGADWRDATDSAFSFEATVEGVATPGTFQKFDVEFTFDPAVPDEARLLVTIDLRAADLGDPDMNAVLFDAAWFDTGRFARAMFRSEAIREISEGEYVAAGMLELKGTEKRVDVPFTWRSSGKEATMQGTVVLQRSDFNVGSGEWADDDTIGIDVKLRFAVQLIRTE